MTEPSTPPETRPLRTGEQDGHNSPLSLSDRVRSLRLPERTAEPTTWRSWLPWLLCVALMASTAYFALRERPAEEVRVTAELPSSTPDVQRARPDAQPAAGAIALESKGYIVPVHQIQVSPKVSGMVTYLNIEEGQRVKKDEVLARLEDIEYQADYKRAVALAEAARERWQELASGFRSQEKEQSKAELDEAVAQREQLFLDWKRNLSLKPGVVAARDYEQAESQYRAADRRVERLKKALELMEEGPRKERIKAAWAEVDQAEADLTKAKWRLGNCIVKAPITGTLLTKKAEEGTLVNPAAFNISATLCDMADLSDMEVDLAIPERDIGKIFKGQKCQVRAEAFPDRVYEGKVSRLMPTADRAKGAVPVRVKISIPREEEGQFLRPEMGALVSFFNESAKP